MGVRSVASDALDLATRDAATAVAQSGQGGPWNLLGQLMRRIRDHQNNHVHGSPIAVAPTTASTQLTGATGVTEVRVNLPAFAVTVNGTQKEFAAEADRVLHDTTVYTGADAGTGDSTLTTANKLAKITIVAKNASGTITLVNCKGATHATAAVECTDAEINTKVSSVPWVKVAVVAINRTGDTTITQTQDNTVQPRLGVNQDQEFFNAWTD